MNNEITTHNLNLIDDGISLINGLISDDNVKTLNEELDYLFSKKSSNGSLNEIKLSKHTSYINIPTLAVRSMNLLELCLSVKNELEKVDEKFKSYVNTGIEIVQESRQPILPWHTDNRSGMVRALIYIELDIKGSGRFRYMKKTHKRDFFVDHQLNKQQIETYSPNIINCDLPVGSLILFDSFGFHGREKCVGKRRVILFEFQRKDTPYPKTAVPLSSRILTKNVVRNLSVFLDDSIIFTEYRTGGEKYYRSPPEQNIIKRIINKIKSLLL
jgi:hypothetical protein